MELTDKLPRPKKIPEAEYVHPANDTILVYQEGVLKSVQPYRLVEQATRVDVAAVQSMAFEHEKEILKLKQAVMRLKERIVRLENK